LDLLDKLSLAFATPTENLLDCDVISELERMNIPADLLQTKKLSDLNIDNSGDDNLFNNEIILSEDLEKHFAKLPSFIKRAS
jgi:hypothetical protein